MYVFVLWETLLWHLLGFRIDYG